MRLLLVVLRRVRGLMFPFCFSPPRPLFVRQCSTFLSLLVYLIEFPEELPRRRNAFAMFTDWRCYCLLDGDPSFGSFSGPPAFADADDWLTYSSLVGDWLTYSSLVSDWLTYSDVVAPYASIISIYLMIKHGMIFDSIPELRECHVPFSSFRGSSLRLPTGEGELLRSGKVFRRHAYCWDACL